MLLEQNKKKSEGAEQKLVRHQAKLKACRLCPAMVGPVITPGPVTSRIYLCGQAPGPHEGELGRPFAWTAGKTLFRWFERHGVDEETFRSKAYIGAVCRCFPGKTAAGGDRVPNAQEIGNCTKWMKAEFELLKPQLVIPVGKLAIELFLPGKKLVETVGTSFHQEIFGCDCDVIPLPHPSGASTWFKVEPGSTLLIKALNLLAEHKVWKDTFST